MHVVVTGGRDYKDRHHVWAVLGERNPRRVAHGGATGADTLARQWAQFYRREEKRYPADWSLGRKAGPLRNRQMLESEMPDLVIAFPGGRGTESCVREALDLGLRVERLNP